MKPVEYSISGIVSAMLCGCLFVWDPPGDTRLAVHNRSELPIYFRITFCDAVDTTFTVVSIHPPLIHDDKRDTIIDKPGDTYVPVSAIDHPCTPPGWDWPEAVHRSGGYLCIYFFSAEEVDRWPQQSELAVLEKQRISLGELNASSWRIVYPRGGAPLAY